MPGPGRAGCSAGGRCASSGRCTASRRRSPGSRARNTRSNSAGRACRTTPGWDTSRRRAVEQPRIFPRSAPVGVVNVELAPGGCVNLLFPPDRKRGFPRGRTCLVIDIVRSTTWVDESLPVRRQLYGHPFLFAREPRTRQRSSSWTGPTVDRTRFSEHPLQQSSCANAADAGHRAASICWIREYENWTPDLDVQQRVNPTSTKQVCLGKPRPGLLLVRAGCCKLTRPNLVPLPKTRILICSLLRWFARTGIFGGRRRVWRSSEASRETLLLPSEEQRSPQPRRISTKRVPLIRLYNANKF